MCVEHMRQHDFNVGGEQSGHIILSDYGTTGDGLVAALQMLAAVKRRGKTGERGLPPLRAGAAASPQCPHFTAASRSKTCTCSRRSPMPEAELAKNGRLVIRPSGTEPLIRVMAEGDDRGQIERIVNELIGTISGVRTAA